MLAEKRKKFFSDIIPQEVLFSTFVSGTNRPEVDFSDVMWDAAFGREKRAARKRKHEVITDEYIFDEVDYTKIRASKRLSRKELNEIMEFINNEV